MQLKTNNSALYHGIDIRENAVFICAERCATYDVTAKQYFFS